MTEQDFKYMIEAIAADMAEMLSCNYGMGISEALDTIYNSDTYAKLIDSSTGLYFQSSEYVYSYLKEELATGKIA